MATGWVGSSITAIISNEPKRTRTFLTKLRIGIHKVQVTKNTAAGAKV